MRVSGLPSVALLVLVLAPAAARAQMPDLRAMSGKPLPVADLPVGTVSVRVVREQPANPVAGAVVTAQVTPPGGAARAVSERTGNDGRATFSGLPVGAGFAASVTVDGEALATASFSVPAQGGVRAMLVAGVGAGGAGSDAARAQAHAVQAGDERRFLLGAATGHAAPDPALPAGVLEVELVTPGGTAKPDVEVQLGQVGADGKVRVQVARADARGVARFSGLPITGDVSYAAVVEDEGMRLGTDGFRMPAGAGVRARIRSLERTSDPSVLRLDPRSKVVVDVREDALAVMQSHVFKNVSEKLFVPGDEGLVLPLAEGATGAQELGGGVTIEIREREGAVARVPIPPNAAALFAARVQVGFILKAGGESRVEVRQRMPFGMESPLVLVPVSAGLAVDAPGAKRLADDRDAQGSAVALYELPEIAPGGTLVFTVDGLPQRPRTGQRVAAVLCFALLGWAIVFGRGPRKAARDDRDDRLARLTTRREELFAELVEVERRRRQGEAGLDEPRRVLIGKLESTYRELAKLELGEAI